MKHLRFLALRVAITAMPLVIFAGCGKHSEQTSPESTSSEATNSVAQVANAEWPKFVDEYIESYMVANPAIAASLGRHEFDGQLPDWSADGIKKEISRLEQLRTRAVAFEDAALLPTQRFQRDYLISRIDDDLFWMRDAQQPFTNPEYYFNRGLDPSTYISVPYAPVETRLKAFVEYAKRVPSAIAQIKANLKTPLSKPIIEYGIASFGGFPEFFRGDALAAFAEVKDEALQKQLHDAIWPASKAMEDITQWLRSQQASGTDDFALGPEKFAAMLRMTENVTTPIDKLEQIGKADLERNLNALTEACKQFAPNATVQVCVAKVAADKPKGGAVSGAREQLAQLKQYIIDHDIVSVPGTEEAQVEEAPAYRRQNFAYINIPGPYEKNLPSVYYIAPPDPKWPKAEQLAYVPGKADLLFTSVHEVWPGHFLQFLHSNRSSWRFGQIFVGYAFAEGWAHYTEELMIEKGLADNAPDRHVGQLLNALLRNVRFVCAIGLHTEGMKVSECEQMFKDKAFQDPGNARQQAVRGTYDPAYLNYTLGKLMIRKLRNDWTASRGGEQAWKAFHDQFLSYGGPPIPLVRAQMIKGPAGELF